MFPGISLSLYDHQPDWEGGQKNTNDDEDVAVKV